MRDYLIRRVRKGLVANLEFRPNDDVKLHWRNFYNRYEDTEQQPEVRYDYRNGDLENQTATSGTFTEGEGERVNTKRFEIQSILSSTIGGGYRHRRMEPGGLRHLRRDQAGHPVRQRVQLRDSTKRFRCPTTPLTTSGVVDCRAGIPGCGQLRIQPGGARRPADRGRPADRPGRLSARHFEWGDKPASSSSAPSTSRARARRTRT